jgi:S1-C subfamily serine protease
LRLLAPFALLIAVVSATPSYSAPSPEGVVRRALQSLVRVSFEREGVGGFCTGFVVNAGGHVVTAEHCVPESGVVYIDGAMAHVLKKDTWLVLLGGGPAGVKPPLPIAKKLPEVLAPVWVLGNGYDLGMSVLRRGIAKVAQAEEHTDLIFDAPIAQGMSGGPTINEAGEVVAVNQITMPAMGMGCGADAIRKLLK